MAGLLSCSRDSEEGSKKADLNWLFNVVAFCCSHFPVSHYFLVLQSLLFVLLLVFNASTASFVFLAVYLVYFVRNMSNRVSSIGQDVY